MERSVDPAALEWGSTAPEHIRQLIEWKSARYGGITWPDLGAGQDAYKSRLCNGSYPVAGGAV